MSKLSKYIKEHIDLSSLWLTMDVYNVHYVDKIDYCMLKVYGTLTAGSVSEQGGFV
jgi:hypothetical protein